MCVRTGLCSGFGTNSKTGLRQASFTLLMFCHFLFCLFFGFGFFFSSSRVEKMAFVHLQFAAFITSTFIRDCGDISAFFLFFPSLQFLNILGYAINF